jgi:hypothetical protein
MKKVHRDDLVFGVIGFSVFVALAAVGAKVRMELAYWYVANCWKPDTTCKLANAYTDYWAVILVVFALLAAVAINRLYQARLELRAGKQESRATE